MNNVAQLFKEEPECSQLELMLMSALCDSNDRASILMEIGLTNHTDLGSEGDFYLDKIEIGPFNTIVKTPKDNVDIDPNPLTARLSNVLFEAGIFFEKIEEIAKANPINLDKA